MPTYTVLLAHDVSHYGSVSVEGDTWQEAVASLTSSSWDECTEAGADHYEMRVVCVEDERSGQTVAEDIAYSSWLVHSLTVIHRLTTIMDTCDVPDDTAAALVAYIDELRTMVQDPIFNKESV